MLKEDGNFDFRVNNRYQLKRKLGSGGHGVVYEATDLVEKQDVAIKLEWEGHEWKDLGMEADIYAELSGQPGIPETYWYGNEGEFRVLAFELLGPSLQDLLNYCGGTFSLKTVLMLADQLIPRLQLLHRTYIHRDIQPGNILKGAGGKGNTIYLVDLGFARPPLPGHLQDDSKPGNGHGWGTFLYRSNRAHAAACPRDDLESLGYVLVYLHRGSLPWGNNKAVGTVNEAVQMGRKKKETSIQDLCAGLPKPFELYFEYLASLPAFSKPDYAYLRGLFRKFFFSQGFKYDHVFDWTELKFLELLKKEETESSGHEPLLQASGKQTEQSSHSENTA